MAQREGTSAAAVRQSAQAKAKDLERAAPAMVNNLGHR